MAGLAEAKAIGKLIVEVVRIAVVCEVSEAETDCAIGEWLLVATDRAQDLKVVDREVALKLVNKVITNLLGVFEIRRVRLKERVGLLTHGDGRAERIAAAEDRGENVKGRSAGKAVGI